MACGLPVICTNGSSLMEVVQGGVTGYLCSQDDVAAFAQACRQLGQNPQVQAVMQNKVREWVVQSFTIETMLQSYCSTYQKLCNAA